MSAKIVYLCASIENFKIMQEYQIRLMTMDDYDQVYALWSITEGMALRGYDDSAEGIAKFLKRTPPLTLWL